MNMYSVFNAMKLIETGARTYKQPTSFFCILKLQNESTLSVGSSNIANGALLEELKSYISGKLEKNLVFVTGTIGTLPASFLKLEVSRDGTEKLAKAALCYYCLFEDKQHILCLVCLPDNDEHFELFRSDLNNLALELQKKMPTDEQTISKILVDWYETCIEYLTRGIIKLSNILDNIIHGALLGKTFFIITDNEDEGKRISRLIANFSIISQLSEKEMKIQILSSQSATSKQKDALYIDLTGSENLLNSTETNEFCQEWAKEINEVAINIEDPLFLQYLIQSKKAKIISELNTLQRQVTYARLDNNILYKCYRALKLHKNSDVLLHLISNLFEKVTDDAILSVLDVLQERFSDLPSS